MRQPARPGSKPASRRQKARANPFKRSLNALAIADAQTYDNRGQRSHRLGEIDEGWQSGSRPRKRPLEDDANGDLEGGSDSDGNEWKVGVNSDNDSDIDSDEAFGDSDEDRYEGYVFRGSSKFRGPKYKAKKEDREPEEEDEDEEQQALEEDDGLIDLATALDQADNSEIEDDSVSDDELENPDEFSGSDVSSKSDLESDSASESEDGILSKSSALQNLVSSLPADEPARKKQRLQGGLEMQPDSIYAVPSTQKLTLEDMMAVVTDPTLRKSLKMMDSSRDTTSKKGQARKLDVPLPQRQQDRINRAAAYEKANETLGRWVETVQHNRRADHLQFPLAGSSSAPVPQSKKLVGNAPLTSLEQRIHDLMVESGLAGPVPEDNSDDEDDEVAEKGFEELKANKLSLAEVQAKRAELRLARELIFREEKRAKRIKKIKSKSYRRVLRKQAEKEDKQSAAALAAAGIETEDQEALEIRRAEARMGSRHRDSKWAKSAKRSGKTVWDEDVKAGMIEMAQRQEELTRRIQGRLIRNGDDSDSSEGDDESSSDEGDTKKELELLRGDMTTLAGKKSGLMALKFMQKAQNDLRLQNQNSIDEMTRELHGLSPRENEAPETGRKKYGSAAVSQSKPLPASVLRPDVYDSEASNGDEEAADDEVEVIVKHRPSSKGLEPTGMKQDDEQETANPWLNLKPEKNSRRNNGAVVSHESISDLEHPSVTLNGSGRLKQANSDVLIDPKAVLQVRRTNSKLSHGTEHKTAKTSSKSVALLAEGNSDDEDVSEPEQVESMPALRDDLIRRAFAGDDVLAEFAKEKEEVMEEDDDKLIDTTLPGWGNWTGDGLSKKAQSRNKGRFFVKKEGLKKENRKDAKLDRVILNEKRIKKNHVYLASTLPHPFETREQYERSLRLPVGPEWTTKETFQNATKPRILLKQGIIDPISKPIL